jgi:hypothetical protein
MAYNIDLIIGKYYCLSYVGEDTSLYYVDHKRSSNSMLPQNWNLIVQLWWLAIIMKNRALTKKKPIKNSKNGKLRKNATLTLTIIFFQTHVNCQSLYSSIMYDFIISADRFLLSSFNLCTCLCFFQFNFQGKKKYVGHSCFSCKSRVTFFFRKFFKKIRKISHSYFT